MKLGILLSAPIMGEKVFWSTLKKLSNRKKTNTLPIIDNNLYETNTTQKATFFNDCLQSNTQFMTMGVLYHHLVSKLALFFPTSLQILKKLLKSFCLKRNITILPWPGCIACLSEIAIPMLMILNSASVRTGTQ